MAMPDEIETHEPMALRIEVALPGVELVELAYEGTDCEIFLYYENTRAAFRTF